VTALDRAGTPGVLRSANLLLRFLLELAALAALAVWGASVDALLALRCALAVVAPTVAMLAWARWAAPKARDRSTPTRSAVTQVLVFGSAGAALAASGHLLAGVVLVALSAGNAALLHLWKQ
jgi:hypothetical protein